MINSNFRPANALSRLQLALWVCLVIAIIGYGLFESSDLLRGPNLVVTSPQDGAMLTDSLIHIEGRTARIAKISIAGRQIFTQGDGSFKESLLLGSGYNIIEVKVEDQFGREISKKLRLVLK